MKHPKRTEQNAKGVEKGMVWYT